ncbi:MAG: heparan-alpha-glucosaminide N-acetyltransferase domain-containing protein [Bacteroides cellulosilyticus]
MENSHPPISTSPQKKRLLSLDVLRGITVVGMILVNNSGGKLSYDSLQHSAWNGLTLCDLVFPFFLFIMGVSTYIALSKFHFQASGSVVRKVLKRTRVILCIGRAISHWLLSSICDGDFISFAHLLQSYGSAAAYSLVLLRSFLAALWCQSQHISAGSLAALSPMPCRFALYRQRICTGMIQTFRLIIEPECVIRCRPPLS